MVSHVVFHDAPTGLDRLEFWMILGGTQCCGQRRSLTGQAAILAQEQIFYRACTAPVLTYQGSKECHSWLNMYRAVLYESAEKGTHLRPRRYGKAQCLR